MIRLLISILCALGLVFAPMTAGMAAQPNASKQACAMDKMPAKPVDHAKMDCCAPACQVSSAAALLPQLDPGADQFMAGNQLHARVAVKALESFAPTGLDPPPRA